MDTSTMLKGNWNELKGKLKQQYSKLTDDDLLYQEGRENELLGRLQKALGKTEDEVKDMLYSLNDSETTTSSNTYRSSNY